MAEGDYDGPNCGYALYGPPAICTCGQCEEVVEDEIDRLAEEQEYSISVNGAVFRGSLADAIGKSAMGMLREITRLRVALGVAERYMPGRDGWGRSQEEMASDTKLVRAVMRHG